jgi:hypothetical protein
MAGFVPGCGRNASVELSVDFSSAPQWRYYLDARVTGSVGADGSKQMFESAARCSLSGTVDRKSPYILHVTVPSSNFSSTILNAAELENLMSQSQDVRLSCDLNEGSIVPDDTANLPLVMIGEWDIFKDLAKAIPALPKIPVAPGAAWDREKAVPLDTRHGPAIGHLTQSFRLDSVLIGPRGKRTALVSWIFTYRIELRGPDTSRMLGSMPSGGKGTGTALINVDDKTLERASMSFGVPEAQGGKFRISWNEEISLRRVY